MYTVYKLIVLKKTSLLTYSKIFHFNVYYAELNESFHWTTYMNYLDLFIMHSVVTDLWRLFCCIVVGLLLVMGVFFYSKGEMNCGKYKTIHISFCQIWSDVILSFLCDLKKLLKYERFVLMDLWLNFLGCFLIGPKQKF